MVDPDPAPGAPEVATRAGRARRKALRGMEILLTPALLREQITYWRHGPAPPPAPPEPAEGVAPPTFPPSPWAREPDLGAGAACNICNWSGAAFDGPQHVEAQLCPSCGSNARDRFLFACFVERNDPCTGATVLETSPRMGSAYRQAMHGWFTYLCSDYDASCHSGELQLDLQHLGLRDDAVDVLLSPHVLEHVPDTDAALAEIRRVLAPDGVLYLQVPILQGRTAPPTEPEFHGDNTPVFWRFGFDLTARLRAAGFETTLLCTQPLLDVVTSGLTDWPSPVSPEFDAASMLDGAIAADLTPLLDKAAAERLGLWQAYMFATWECRVA